MMSNDDEGDVKELGWWPIIQDLRQDQQIISEKWQQARKTHNELNTRCDQLIQSLWLVHSLDFSLHKVLNHRILPSEWIASRDEASTLQYLHSSQVMSPTVQESYSRFLGNLRTQPQAVSEVLQWAGNEGLDTSHLAYDLISVVYGNCLFTEDHCYLLEVICTSLKDHITQCVSFKELFSIEPVCSRLIAEYCHQLPELKVFLSQVLKEPLHHIINKHTRYLEYDTVKAGTRLAENDRDNLDEYVDSSSHFIAETCMLFLYQLNRYLNSFPPTLQWLLGSLKGFILQKWPSLPLASLRRPISYVLFSFIISSAFVNPDLLGILDVHIVLTDVIWYNISQVISVLQGCAWIIDKLNNSDYPMRRVVSHMDMIPFNSVIDNINNGLDYLSPPPVSSMLPGLARSVFISSRIQLDNIIGTFYDACNSFMDAQDITPVQLEVSKAISVIPDSIIAKGRRNPYSFSISNVYKTGSQDELLTTVSSKSPRVNKKNKIRSKSIWGSSRIEKLPEVKENSKSQTLGSSSRTPVTKSISNPSLASIVSPSQSEDFNVSAQSQEVVILPLWKPDVPLFNGNSWNSQLLSEEEYMQSRSKLKGQVSTSSAISRDFPDNSESTQNMKIEEHKSLELTPETSDNSLLSQTTEEVATEKEVSIKSWSPDTYDGSISGDEDNLICPMAKSCEILKSENVSSKPTSLSVPSTPRKGFRAWLGKKMSKSSKKSKKKSSPTTNGELLQMEPCLESLDGSIPPTSTTAVSNRRRIGSYTKRIGHITAKYEQISRERKASEREVKTVTTNFSVPTTSKEWLKLPSTLNEFMSSNLYEQLKYKLTFVFKNIHMPLSSVSNVNGDLKSQLVELLTTAQQVTEWKGEYSEHGVVTETLSQLKELDVECIQALLIGVKGNHFNLLEYLNYLSTFQQQCYNIHLQISDLQNTISRTHKLQEDSFLNFTINMFFEERLAKLDQVRRDLENCETSDEKFVLVQDCRESLRVALEKQLTWQSWADDLEQVYRICDDRIYAYLYDHVFYPNGDSDKQRDGVFKEHIQRIASSVTPQHRLLKISPIYYTSHPWSSVQNLLNDMSLYKSPQAKLNCIVQACKLLIRLLQLAKCGNPPGADDIFPVLVYVLILANPMSLLSTEQYIKVYCEEQLIGGETAYWWTQFCSALGFLKTPDFTHDQQ